MKNKPCRKEKHKWNYYEHHKEGKRIQIRVCKRCHFAQMYISFGPVLDWMYITRFTEKGAMEEIEGYPND
jgi:hypothetical protein